MSVTVAVKDSGRGAVEATMARVQGQPPRQVSNLSIRKDVGELVTAAVVEIRLFGNPRSSLQTAR